MSTLQERLDRMKTAFLEQAPPEAVAIMSRSTEELVASDILDGIPQPGSELPPFALRDSEGNSVGSAELLGRGPLVLTFYRGEW